MKIKASNIGKKYGRHWIFRNVSAVFEQGNVYPVIGNNGSGKSTFLQVISGFVTANEGKLSHVVNGGSIAVEQWYKHMTMATPYLDLFEELNVDETIYIHEKLKPLLISSEAIIAEIDLENHRSKPLSTLSSGMRQRLKLALALYSDVSMILLDEPLTNLDKRWSEWYNEKIDVFKKERITIICSNSNDQELRMANQDPITMGL
ncbi:MAG: ATP-binding cassette domain-containing protein [Salibacteraceae bacterium]